MDPALPPTGARSGSATPVVEAAGGPGVPAATNVARPMRCGGTAGATRATLAAADVVPCAVREAATPVAHADAVACCRCSAG